MLKFSKNPKLDYTLILGKNIIIYDDDCTKSIFIVLFKFVYKYTTKENFKHFVYIYELWKVYNNKQEYNWQWQDSIFQRLIHINNYYNN